MAKDKLGNLAYVKLRDTDISEFDSRISSVENAKHTHANKAILDGTEEAFTTVLKDKIESSTTSADVESIVSNLVDSAPATLDTLNELAQALGDDPNFATTVSTQIGTKVEKESAQALHATDALRVSGTTVSLYKGDGTYESITTQDTNTWRGITDSVSTTSSTTSASATAVKSAYDVGNHSHPYLPSSSAHVALDTSGNTSYPRMFASNNPASSSVWLRVPDSSGGLLPYINAGSYLGTSSWKFGQIHGVNIYENGTALSSKYAPISHTHSYAGSSSAGGAATNSELLDGYDSTVFLKRNSTLESNLDTKYDSDLFGWSSSTVGRPEGYGQGISIVSSGTTYNGSSNWITQLGFGTSGNQGYFRTKVNAGSWSDWHKLWHSGNDGSGSGLDADKLDGVQASQFLRSDTSDTFTSLSGTSLTIGSGVTLQESTDRADLLQISSNTYSWAGLQIRNTSSEGRWSFMTDGSASGFYDDENNKWHIYMVENSYTQLRYNGAIKLQTTNTGVAITGDITVSGTITETSDKRFKKDIQKIDNALDKVNQVNGYTFEKDGHDGRLTGVIAQEVEAILPEAIQKDEEGYLSVSYGNIVGLLIESIKELNAKVERLENAQKS